MDDEDVLSDLESVPPAAAGQAVPAAAAQGAAGNNNPPPPAQHPLWERAAGRGGGGAGGGGKHGGPGQATSQGRFCPISMAALEQRARNEFDGASSVGARTAHARHTTKDAPRREREEDDEEPRGKKKQRVKDFDEPQEDDDDALSDAASGADVVAGAAFGGGKKNSCHTLSIASDTDDGASETSSRAREAHCRAFPIPNETCVGCALPAKVGPVDDFVRTNCDKMKEDALFKMAALVYIQKVVDPAEAEQVPVPVRRRSLLKPPTCASAVTRAVCLKGVGVEGHSVALHDAPHGRQDAALREHAHARGHAQDARAVAPQRGRGLRWQPRAHAGQGQRRADYEDHHAAVEGDLAAARGEWLEQQAGGKEARVVCLIHNL